MPNAANIAPSNPIIGREMPLFLRTATDRIGENAWISRPGAASARPLKMKPRDRIDPHGYRS
jgi:hypothetical protein